MKNSKRKRQTKYKAKKVIGQGGFAKVYEIVSNIERSAFACKMICKNTVLRAAGERYEKAIIALRNEVRLGLTLSHPNIVRLIEVFETTTHVAMVMDQMRGGDLHRYIVTREAVVEPDVVAIISQIVSAIVFMHSCGVVHRDIKPENIMLQSPYKAGQACVIKLIDFGFSRFLSNGEQTCSFVGTSSYAAPEILMSKDYDHKVDVWSLGVLSFVLLSGKFPFDSYLDPVQCVLRGTALRPKFQANEWRAISTEAKRFVHDLLVLEPCARPAADKVALMQWLKEGIQRPVA
eukprot:g3402.t1